MILPYESGDFELTDDMIAGFQLEYPHVQVRDECLKASLWLYRHPSFRPVYPLRFLANWLKKLKPKTVKLHLAAGGKLTEHELIAMGQRLGLSPYPGESWVKFGVRVSAAQDKARA